MAKKKKFPKWLELIWGKRKDLQRAFPEPKDKDHKKMDWNIFKWWNQYGYKEYPKQAKKYGRFNL